MCLLNKETKEIRFWQSHRPHHFMNKATVMQVRRHYSSMEKYSYKLKSLHVRMFCIKCGWNLSTGFVIEDLKVVMRHYYHPLGMGMTHQKINLNPFHTGIGGFVPKSPYDYREEDFQKHFRVLKAFSLRHYHLRLHRWSGNKTWAFVYFSFSYNLIRIKTISKKFFFLKFIWKEFPLHKYTKYHPVNNFF